MWVGVWLIVWVGLTSGLDCVILMGRIREEQLMHMETKCRDCKLVYDALDHLDGCPSLSCIALRIQRKRGAADGRWWQCKNCRKFYQSHRQLDICPTCQAKHDAAVARDRAQLEAMKRPIGG